MTLLTCPQCAATALTHTKQVKTTFKPRPKSLLLLRGLMIGFLGLWTALFVLDRSSAKEAIVIIPVALVLLFISFMQLIDTTRTIYQYRCTACQHTWDATDG